MSVPTIPARPASPLGPAGDSDKMHNSKPPLPTASKPPLLQTASLPALPIQMPAPVPKREQSQQLSNQTSDTTAAPRVPVPSARRAIINAAVRAAAGKPPVPARRRNTVDQVALAAEISGDKVNEEGNKSPAAQLRRKDPAEGFIETTSELCHS